MTATKPQLAKGTRRRGQAAAKPLVAPWTLPRGLARRWETLWDAQFWCFGQDVVSPSGNHLAAYGFERRPAPPEVEARSRYVRAAAAGEDVRLWGFGGWWGRSQGDGLFILRVEGDGRWLRPAKARKLETVYRWEDLPRGDVPTPAERETVHLLMQQALGWVVAYERWIADRCGPEHRRDALSRWRKPQLAEEPLADAWERFRDDWIAGALREVA